MHVHQFLLTLAFKHILVDKCWSEVGDAQFFADFTPQCFAGRLSKIHMPANSSIPLPRLYVFPVWATLQIDLALGIEHMKMNYGVQQLRTAMTLASRGRANHVAIFVY